MDVTLSWSFSMAAVSVLRVRLVTRHSGEKKSVRQEADQVRNQVVNALDEADESKTPEHDRLSPHFDIRVSELLDNRVAIHGDTLMDLTPNNSMAVISYPEFLCRSDRPEVLVTARQWKRLLRPHSMPVVNTRVASNRNPPATAAELRQSLGIVTDN